MVWYFKIMALPYQSQIEAAIEGAQTSRAFCDFQINAVPRFPENCVYVANETELTVLYEAALTLLGEKPTAQKTKNAIDHEVDHVTAAKIVGCHNFEYGIAFGLVAIDRRRALLANQLFAHFANVEGISDLKRAAILAYPETISKGDIVDIERIGYDVDRVGYEAIRHNEIHGYEIPVPKTYQQSHTVIIA